MSDMLEHLLRCKTVKCGQLAVTIFMLVSSTAGQSDRSRCCRCKEDCQLLPEECMAVTAVTIGHPDTSKYINCLHLLTRPSSPPLVTVVHPLRSSLCISGHLLAKVARPLSVSREDPDKLTEVMRERMQLLLLVFSRLDRALSVSRCGLCRDSLVHRVGDMLVEYSILQTRVTRAMSVVVRYERMCSSRSWGNVCKLGEKAGFEINSAEFECNFSKHLGFFSILSNMMEVALILQTFKSMDTPSIEDVSEEVFDDVIVEWYPKSLHSGSIQ